MSIYNHNKIKHLLSANMTFRSTRHMNQIMGTIASKLGFTNEIRELHRFTNDPNIVIIIEQPSPESDYTHVVVMHLTDNKIFYNKTFPAFPASLADANITIDDDGLNIFLVINGPSYGVYYTLHSRETTQVA